MLSPVSLVALQNLFNAGQNPVFMTAGEGQELAQAGLITVVPSETSPVNPLAYRVHITEAGVNALSAPVAPVAPVASAKPVYAIADNIPIPTVKRGNPNIGNQQRESSYPFEQLQINQSFHVPCTSEDAEPWKKMASNVAAANTRSLVEVVPQEMVTTEHRKMRVDAEGKPILSAEGKKQYDKFVTTEPKKVATKRFIARRVDATDPCGAGVRVFRVALDAKV